MKSSYEIVIVGGGMIGASLACALTKENISVAVIEAVSAKADDQPSYDDRGMSLSLSSQRILSSMDIWPLVAAGANPIKQIHVSDRGRFGFVRLQAEKMRLDALGYVVVARELGQALLARLQAASNVDIICPARVTTIRTKQDAVTLDVIADKKEKQIDCKLLVVADGAHSQIRSQLTINTRFKDYGQTAIVTNLTPERPHNDTAYERFTENGPFALLPLTGGRCVAVYTVRSEEVDEVLGLEDTEFLVRAEKCFGLRLGRFTRAGVRKSYPLMLVETEQQVLNRIVLLGNSAHAIHPNGAQGFNLGLRDAAGLAEQLIPGIRTGTDPGAMYLLESYLASRVMDQKRVVRFTDRLTDIYYNRNPAKIIFRDLGMLVTDLHPGLKKHITRKLMGLSGMQPACVRESTL